MREQRDWEDLTTLRNQLYRMSRVSRVSRSLDPWYTYALWFDALSTIL